MLVSGVEQSDSVIHIHIFILFQILFSYRLSQNIVTNEETETQRAMTCLGSQGYFLPELGLELSSLRSCWVLFQMQVY